MVPAKTIHDKSDWSCFLQFSFSASNPLKIDVQGDDDKFVFA